MTYFVSIET